MFLSTRMHKFYDLRTRIDKKRVEYRVLREEHVYEAEDRVN